MSFFIKYLLLLKDLFALIIDGKLFFILSLYEICTEKSHLLYNPWRAGSRRRSIRKIRKYSSSESQIQDKKLLRTLNFGTRPSASRNELKILDRISLAILRAEARTKVRLQILISLLLFT